MKRTGIITLALLSTASLMVLSGCDDQPKDDQVFANIQACEEVYSADDCQNQFAQAEQTHTQNAPHFQAMTTCEEQYGAGQCREHEGGWIMPMMIGVMIGRSVSQPVPLYYGPSTCSNGNNSSNCNNRSVYSSVHGGGYVGTYTSAGNGRPMITTSQGRAVSVTSSSARAGTSFATGSSIGSGGRVAVGGFGASAAGHAGGSE